VEQLGGNGIEAKSSETVRDIPDVFVHTEDFREDEDASFSRVTRRARKPSEHRRSIIHFDFDVFRSDV